MTRFWSFLLLLLFYIVGLLLFTRGFLLKRTVLSHNSSCTLDFETVPPPSSWHRGGAMPKGNVGGASEDGRSHGCWMVPRYKKAVIILIDALRFDFIAETEPVGSNALYSNRLTVVTETIATRPQNSRLYRFIADAPTTTLQRLKGLTTGSLPTFVDAGANFASTEITEDNVIDQLLKVIPNMTFVGDDTWVSLFPHRFHRSFPYPSFNTKDLHTVDNGVIGRLVEEIEREDTGLVIGHLLGVDHCGHTYGPNSLVMAEKLDQMNVLIGSVMSAISDDTLLLVMGDHGMTRSGDHGGDSPDEVNSALFVYSKSHITSAPSLSKGVYETISQIDLVPTLSLLLGAAIPFSNLGLVITELFDSAPRASSEASFSDAHVSEQKEDEVVTSMNYVIQALRLNALQVSRYVDSYASASGDLSVPALDTLRQLLSTANNDFNNLNLEGLSTDISGLQQVRDVYKSYLSGVRLLCQSVWAQFDLEMMAAGIAVSISTLVIHVALLSSSVNDSGRGDILMAIAEALCLVSPYGPTIGEHSSKCSKRCRVVFRVVGVFVLWLGCIAVFITNLFSVLSSVVMATLAVVYFITFVVSVRRLCRWLGHASGRHLLDDRFSLVLWLIYVLAMSSNSYVVWEQDVGAFLLLSLVLGLGVKSFCSSTFSKLVAVLSAKQTSKQESSPTSGRSEGGPGYSDALHVVIFAACVRASHLFLTCREEHGPTCQSSFFLLPLTSLSEELLFVRVSTAIISIGTIVVLVYKWLSHHGNLNGSAPSVFLAAFVCPAAAICVGAYWCMLGLPPRVNKRIPSWLSLGSAQTVYWLIGIALVTSVASPLCLFLLPRRNRKSAQKADFILKEDQDLIPQLYHHLRDTWQSEARGNVSCSAAVGKNRSSRSKRSVAEEDPVSSDGVDAEATPVVYGLATAYSSSSIVLITSVSILLALLVGEGLAPSLLLLAAALFCLLELHASYTAATRRDHAVSWPSVCALCLLASEYFFLTGHQATIPSIRFEAAFHGFRGDFRSNAVPATLITLNTFAGPILCTLALPLFIYWPLTRYLTPATTGSSPPSGVGTPPDQNTKGLITDGQKGEFVLNENGEILRLSLDTLFNKFTFLMAVKMVACMLCVTIHRRHLMVWKIFAPRFIYEGATFLVVSLALVFTYSFVLRVHSRLTAWIHTNIYTEPTTPKS